VTAPQAPGAESTAAAAPVPVVEEEAPEFRRIVASIAELADDPSVPRNIRKGALAAKEELSKPRVPRDVRIAGAVYLLDDLANDPNLPTHGRTAIWSIISSLESIP
jgi:uncharacterized protein